MNAVQYNPFNSEAHADPYPMYRQLREQEPVHWSEQLDAWALTRYDDVVGVLKDPRFSSNRRNARNRFAEQAAAVAETAGPAAQATSMLSADPPAHTRLRGLVSKAFTPKAVEALRPRVHELVDELLDSAQGAGGFDVIEDLAYPLPVVVIAEMLGVPAEDRAQFKRWSDDVVATLGGRLLGPEVQERASRSTQELATYFRGVIAERRREPKEDLLSGLIAAEEAGQALTEEELLATCILLLVAGNETTTNLIGNGMLALLRNPDQLAKLRADPSLVDSAVEEFLRFDGPVQATARVAKEDVEIGGRTISEGQLVFTLIGAANRDPERFPDPESLDIARRPNRHIAFGTGIHTCLGAPLARLEAQVAFDAMLRRLPEPRLVSDEVHWRGGFILRGLERLAVAF